MTCSGSQTGYCSQYHLRVYVGDFKRHACNSVCKICASPRCGSCSLDCFPVCHLCSSQDAMTSSDMTASTGVALCNAEGRVSLVGAG